MDFNKKNIRIILEIILFTVLLVSAVNHVAAISEAIAKVLELLSPFIIGACLAFILNVPMGFFEDRFFGRFKKLRRVKRPLALLLAICVVLMIILIVLFLVIPEIISTLGTIMNSLPDAVDSISEWIQNISKENPQILSLISQISADWENSMEQITSVLKNGMDKIWTSTLSLLSGTVSTIVNFLIGFVFSIYILLQKERLARQGKQVIYAFLPEPKADSLLEVLRLTNDTFQKFITGQCTEALILGTMFLIAMSIFGIPYAFLISALIALMALIPIFGAFIGCAVGTFLILFVNPIQALWFLILFLILQQIEGNLIYPYVVGNSVGLPSIWVLAAVIIGGNLMGVMGMLIFIPLCSVLYALFQKNVKNRIQMKKISDTKLE